MFKPVAEVQPEMNTGSPARRPNTCQPTGPCIVPLPTLPVVQLLVTLNTMGEPLDGVVEAVATVAMLLVPFRQLTSVVKPENSTDSPETKRLGPLVQVMIVLAPDPLTVQLPIASDSKGAPAFTLPPDTCVTPFVAYPAVNVHCPEEHTRFPVQVSAAEVM